MTINIMVLMHFVLPYCCGGNISCVSGDHIYVSGASCPRGALVKINRGSLAGFSVVVCVSISSSKYRSHSIKGMYVYALCTVIMILHTGAGDLTMMCLQLEDICFNVPCKCRHYKIQESIVNIRCII